MQNKGFVKIFSLLLILVCSFYLSFTFVTTKYENKAIEYANAAGELSENERAEKEKHFLDSLSNKKVWLGYTLKECQEMEISLGLDLKGGMNVVLELNVADVIRSLANNNPDENFNKALALAYERQTSSQSDFIDLFADEYKKLEPNSPLASIFSTFELKERITPQSTDIQVKAVIKEELQSAIDNSFNVLRTRIDRFGVVSPNIQRLERAGRILVELPGVKEEERVRKLLQGSANLEFWETYDVSEVYSNLIEADRALALILDVETAKDSTKTEVAAAPNAANVNSADSLLAQIGVQDSSFTTIVEADMEKANPLLYLLRNGQPHGAIVGYANKKDIEKVNEYLNMKQVKDALPRNLSLKWGVKAVDDNDSNYPLYAIRVTNRDGRPALGGDVVVDAKADFTQQPGTRIEQQVSMRMNAEGGKAWARLTKENIGRSVAIVLDDMVYSAPRVNDEITGGSSQITGDFTPEEAKDLANVLKSGKMAASVHIVQEDVVGPSLGQEAINDGMMSFIVALIILFAYMCAFYGFIPGMIANGALLLNFFFTMGILASFQAVLTLPGIAGMVLTLGMAVDANVLIYERTKEELAAGKSVAKAISDGYTNAFSAIFDANVTSIITGIVLLGFGVGPIRGFATTMIIGLGVSFLTAVFLTRIVYEHFLSKGKFNNLTFTTAWTKNLLRDPKINFLGKRKAGYMIPAAIIILGAVSLSTVGLNSGIDFTGGRNYIIKFEGKVSTEDVRDLLAENLDAVNVITIGKENIRVSTNYKIADNSPTVDQEIVDIMYANLGTLLPEGTTIEQFKSDHIINSQKVGPSMADDIKNSAIIAVIIAMFCMAMYILVRFRDVAFSIGVFASVVVVTACIVAFYSMFWKLMPFSMEIDQTFIAAVLTIIGYSLNDTVVIFDRIRETTAIYPKRDRFVVINHALNSTLTRTISTGLSTFVVIVCIFILGGSTIRSFTFAIMLGIMISLYSTLFVATPIAYELQKRKLKKRGVETKEDMED